jgi:PAS domain S-box-containing protein
LKKLVTDLKKIIKEGNNLINIIFCTITLLLFIFSNSHVENFLIFIPVLLVIHNSYINKLKIGFISTLTLYSIILILQIFQIDNDQMFYFLFIISLFISLSIFFIIKLKNIKIERYKEEIVILKKNNPDYNHKSKQYEEKQKISISIFENANVGIYRSTPEGKFIMVNESFLAMTRIPSLTLLSSINLEDKEQKYNFRNQNFKKMIETEGKVYSLENEWLRYDGTLIIVNESAWKIVDENGATLYYDGIVEDITERKQTEEERMRLIIQLQNSLSEIKTLSGLLPICSHCKSIRDDTGYWHQIEEYIDSHSYAQFSHGLCPDCAKKLYPNYFSDDNTEDNKKENE